MGSPCPSATGWAGDRGVGEHTLDSAERVGPCEGEGGLGSGWTTWGIGAGLSGNGLAGLPSNGMSGGGSGGKTSGRGTESGEDLSFLQGIFTGADHEVPAGRL